MEDYPLRTSQTFIEDGALATPKTPINGIMGPALVSKLLDHNFTPIDYHFYQFYTNIYRKENHSRQAKIF